MQDGSLLKLHRDLVDRLIADSFTPAKSSDASGLGLENVAVVGFGPWPGYDANRRQRTLTEPDDDSGLFEPERLFVLREQYVFLKAGEQPAQSLGPIEKAWWEGTEAIVQARQKPVRH